MSAPKYFKEGNFIIHLKGDRREVVPFCEIGDLEGFARTYFSKEYSQRLLQKVKNEKWLLQIIHQHASCGNRTRDF